MPHEPWLYLPSGRQSRPAGNDPVEGINKLPGFDDPDLSVHNHLRHLLQVGYTDHLVGELLERLRRTGLLRRALMIVTADHGYSFQVGVRSRRLLSERNVEEIAPVPFFVKAPGQTEGRVDESLVRNIDIVATIADLLGSRSSTSRTGTRRSPAPRGRAGSSGSARATSRRRCASASGDAAPPRALEAALGAPVRHRHREPRPLRRSVGDGLPDRAAPGAARPASVLASVGRDDISAGSPTPRRAAREPGDTVFPTRVTGPLRGVPFGEHRDVAVAVNGRIRAAGAASTSGGRAASTSR